MQKASDDTMAGSVTLIIFVGENQQIAMVPIWFYGSAVKNLYLLSSSSCSNTARNIYSEIKDNPEFNAAEIRMFRYPKTDTRLDFLKKSLAGKGIVSDCDSKIIICTLGCSKPLFLSVILFAEEHNASIILSADSNSLEIFEDGGIRTQTFPNRIKWYLGYHKLRIYPKINAASQSDPIIPEDEFRYMSSVIEDHQMESTIIGNGFIVTVDFVFTTDKLLILGKMFTEEGESFDLPARIFSELKKNFGGNCRLIIYAVGDDLYHRLNERLGSSCYITVINIPDPWCLVEYPQYFRQDLWKIICRDLSG